MPLITATDHLVPLSAITANSAVGCLLSGGITSLWVKERMLEGGWRGSPMFVVSRHRNACQKVLESTGNAACSSSLSLASWWVTNGLCSHPQGSLPHGWAREQNQLPVPNIYMRIEQMHGNAKIALADAIPGSSPREQRSSHPLHPTVPQGRPCLVNFKASAAFREGDVRDFFFPFSFAFWFLLKASEKVCLDTYCWGIPSDFPCGTWQLPLPTCLLPQCRESLWCLGLNQE